jgi:ribulose-phosphate 3-epimerase
MNTPFNLNNLTLLPSILAWNPAQLGLGLDYVAAFGIQSIHIDIMDGHFVPNLTFGPKTVAALRELNPHIFFDTHLMVDNPDRFIETFIQAGSNHVTFHIEASTPIATTLQRVKALGASAGLSLKPNTPVEAVMAFLHAVDLVLVMTVEPGFGGQSFRPEMLTKIQQLYKIRQEKGLSFTIQVDGGIDPETLPLCAQAGANAFVAGTAFFKSKPDAQLLLTTLDQVKASGYKAIN